MSEPLLKLPPLDPLRGFVAAARHLSFTRAAEALCLSQSAISRQVQTLEEALGVRLFARGIRSLALTEEGARLAVAAEGWLNEYARLADAFRAAGPRPVTVTSSIGIAALWLVPRLARFQALHPDIDVRLAAGNRVVDLAREGVDLAVRYCADRDAPPGAIRLFGETVIPVASPAVAARGLDRKRLSETVLLEFDDPAYPWLRWQDWLAALGLDALRPRAMLGFNHYDQLIQAAVAGQGIALGRAELIAQFLADGRLAAVGNGRREVAGRGVWLIHAPGGERAEVAMFAQWLRAEAGTGEMASATESIGPPKA